MFMYNMKIYNITRYYPNAYKEKDYIIIKS